MPELTDLPVEVLLDNLLPSMPNDAILNLGSTNHFFDSLTNDDTFWKRKLRQDFNFDCEATARTTGWKFIYGGLSHPRTFVWGENSHGRLGLESVPKSSIRNLGVPFPTEVKIPGKRIVSLVPGGMSFHALDSEGDVFVWGTLDAAMNALQSDGFADPNKSAFTPHKLQLPAPIRSISCGRLHAMMLSSTLEVYTFRSWGAPYRLISDLLDVSPGSLDAPAQVECGWSFSAVLTLGGSVLVWWPSLGEFDRTYVRETEAFSERVRAGETALKAAATADKVIPCHVWEMRLNPFRLPDLPRNLPDLEAEATGESEERRREDPQTRLIRIAALDNMLVALTNRGHVLRYDRLAHESEFRQSHWEYLSEFSEVGKVQKHAAFTSPQEEADRIEPPKTMQITHISAHFQTFVAYSTGASSIVLMGNQETTAGGPPRIIPALQNRSVISVVLGDYHYGALTSTGKLYTWGGFSKGALGLGDPADLEVGEPGGFETQTQRNAARESGRFATLPSVNVPTEVKFDWGKKKRESFCFSAAAAGWHMGALVIDLEPPSPDEEEHVNMPGSFAPSPTTQQHEGPPLPFRAEGPVRRGPLRVPVLPPHRARGGGFMSPFWMGHAAGRGGAGRGGDVPDA